MRFLFINLSIKKISIFSLILLMSSGVLYSQTQIKYTAHPAVGYIFLQWEDGNKTDTTRFITINQIPDSLSSIPTAKISTPVTSRVMNSIPNIITKNTGIVVQTIIDGNGNVVSSLDSSIITPCLKALFIPSKNGTITEEGSDLIGNLNNCNNELFEVIFKFVEKGSITMISNYTYTISYDFYIGETEVTQELWKAVMGCDNNPSYFNSSDSLPVDSVSWYHALVFCNRLSEVFGVEKVYSINGSKNPDDWGDIPNSNNNTWNAVVCDWNAKGFRLPTETEWKYAANGGKYHTNTTYSGSNTINTVAWYAYNSGRYTHNVKGKQANALGIYDMTGNVYEWCWDLYIQNGLPKRDTTDYRGPNSSNSNAHVKKGGGAQSNESMSTINQRDRPDNYAHTRININGFRIVLTR